jgi:predicted ATPase
MADTQNSFTLIAFASAWGSQHGGINAFNADFLAAMALAYYDKMTVICVVNAAKTQEIEAAEGQRVTLLPLPFKPMDAHMGKAQAKAAVEVIAKQGLTYDPENTIWLGHDRITGEAALAATASEGGRSALIHHMSYDHYEAFAENAQTANEKRNHQESLFTQANILLAVGPVLRDALEDMVDGDVNMIIPGLAEIEPKTKAPNTFSMFVSGRLSQDAAKVKQGQLAVAAFAQCYKQAQQQHRPESLLKRPKLLLRGVNFEGATQDNNHYSSSEQNLQKFAEDYANAVINIQPLPYITDRERLFKDLRSASVAAMPSWHEGFGLVGWEAIAAGVPLIISKNSGVYELIAQNHSGFEQALIWPVNVSGQVNDPYFSDTDLEAVKEAINSIANDPQKARDKALRLKEELSVYTWQRCAEKAAGFFGWDMSKLIQNENAKAHLKHIAISGFKSIQSLDLKLNAINILIGANGAGKTNFISLFTFLRNMAGGRLQIFSEKQGRSSTFFHFGPEHTDKITLDLTVANSGYHVEFGNDSRYDKLVFEQEYCTQSNSDETWPIKELTNESGLSNLVKTKKWHVAGVTAKYLNDCRVYHFHDTGETAKFKQATPVAASSYLYNDASNLAAFLYRLKNEYTTYYNDIVAAIQTVTPFFKDFVLTPEGDENQPTLMLLWQHRNNVTPFSASQLSDGTARFICLATLFLQPIKLMPSTIIIDEPELGLHPAALAALADMVKSAAKNSQVICSTQSVTFANQFDPEDFIVVDQHNGASTFSQLNPDELTHWLEDYQMGDIWDKNLIGGRPQW